MIAPSLRPQKRTRLKRQRLSLSEMPAATYVIGDVHGRYDLYRTLEHWILQDAKRIGAPVLIVLLGDIVDRGPASSQLIDHLVLPAKANLQRLCLLGNHEHMFLEFLDNPTPEAPWLRAGGMQTLRSYGIKPGVHINKELIKRHVPQSHIDFLHKLPVCLQLGPYFLSHAGADPEFGLHDQPEDALIWGAQGAIAHPDATVVHGHRTTDKAHHFEGRISMDTKAYATGVLSAVRLMPNQEPLFMETARKAQNKIQGDPNAGR